MAMKSARPMAFPFPVADHFADSEPVRDDRPGDRGGESDRELVPPRNTAPRDHESEADDHRRNDEAEQRIEIGGLHGGHLASELTMKWTSVSSTAFSSIAWGAGS